MEDKCQVSLKETMELLKAYFQAGVKDLVEIKAGNIKKVYFFSYKDKEYVIRFSNSNHEFKLEQFLSKQKTIECGTYKEYYYSISEKIMGKPLIELDEPVIKSLLPKVFDVMMKIHQIKCTNTIGYGWIGNQYNGSFKNFKVFIESHYSEKQEGYWKNWYELFTKNALSYDKFESYYNHLIKLSSYSERIRHIVHGDFHLGNIISCRNEITGIIDWGNALYGDFILDIATLHMQLPHFNIKEIAKTYYQEHDIPIENYEARFICMSLFKGLDALRFSAKHGDERSCQSIIVYLDNLMGI